MDAVTDQTSQDTQPQPLLPLFNPVSDPGIVICAGLMSSTALAVDPLMQVCTVGNYCKTLSAPSSDPGSLQQELEPHFALIDGVLSSGPPPPSTYIPTSSALNFYSNRDTLADELGMLMTRRRRHTRSSAASSSQRTVLPEHRFSFNSTSTLSSSMTPEDPLAISQRRRARNPQQHRCPPPGQLSLPPPPTPAELWLSEKQSRDGLLSSPDYDSMTHEELVDRLVILENRKRSEEALQQRVATNLGTQAHDKESNTRAKQQTICPKLLPCRWKLCGEVFDQLPELIHHLVEVHVGSGKPYYSCDWVKCPRNTKPFGKRHKMINHLRTHTGERPFVCLEPGCAKRFSRPDALATHIRTHSNVRPFICQVEGCGRTYYHTRSLKKHELTHA